MTSWAALVGEDATSGSEAAGCLVDEEVGGSVVCFVAGCLTDEEVVGGVVSRVAAEGETRAGEEVGGGVCAEVVGERETVGGALSATRAAQVEGG
jgi:hypothetical protein